MDTLDHSVKILNNLDTHLFEKYPEGIFLWIGKLGTSLASQRDISGGQCFLFQD